VNAHDVIAGLDRQSILLPHPGTPDRSIWNPPSCLTPTTHGYAISGSDGCAMTRICGPKSLEELQQAVNDPKPGYDVHHIVEQTAAERFGFARSETEHPENLVRIPRLQHYRITGWYMRENDKFDRLSPREYLQDKDWEERYRVGLEALKEFKVLK
jgi:hypothetical protein